MDEIKVGLTGEQTTTVTEETTARHLGSGGVGVFSTPSMIALMEYSAVTAIDPHLPEGQASVGTEVCIKHLKATPLGQQVRAQAEVIEIDRRRVLFKVQAWDEKQLIGEGTHTRFVIDVARFAGGVG